jgi:hypothetical protein
MPLKRSTGEPRLARDGVYFPMEDATTSRRVECHVDKDALGMLGTEEYDMFDFYESRFPGFVQLFMMFRDQVEAAASAEYDRGEKKPSLDYVSVFARQRARSG